MKSLDFNEFSPVSRYVVGIDLGTTNSAVCFVDTETTPLEIRTFPIPQWIAANLLESRETLPSFYYFPAEGEFPEIAAQKCLSASSKKTTAKERFVVGVLARDHGAKVPDRMISSAKSWLSHSGVDRTAPLLPWRLGEDAEKISDKKSPVEISARYLEHIKIAWDKAYPEHPLAQQDLVLTLPASFDEVARELTISAAKLAGLPKLVLLEEPQAAFYSWMSAYAEEPIAPNRKILVCDLGGGTTDFTLIQTNVTEEGKLRFARTAVGEHLILGGDNFDLALAHYVQNRLVLEKRIPATSETEGGTRLPNRIWSQLIRICCQLKELMLGQNAPESTTLHLPGVGSKLIGGGLQIELTQKEVRDVLIEGFFPVVPLNVRPNRAVSGFREFGLPYAADPAITKHLAFFLTAHATNENVADENTAEKNIAARPDIVLFNGGVFESDALKERLVSVLQKWFRTGSDDPWTPQILANPQLYLAVARGAAYYGMVRRGVGERISASLARTYYVGVEGVQEESKGMRAVCLLPASVEPDQEIALDHPLFELLIGTPVSFPLFVSSLRLTDQPGDFVEISPEQLTALPPIRTVLKTRRKKQTTVRVRLVGKLTEIGTLELAAQEIPEPDSPWKTLNWRLEFDVRSTTQTEREAHQSDAEEDGFLDESLWEEMQTILQRTFTTDFPAAESIKPSELMRHLSQVFPINRDEWPTSLLRKIGQYLMDLESGRRLSDQHEARWLNLLGYAYRPGFGFAMDDYRIDTLWKTLQKSLIHKSKAVATQWWVLLRRVAGGLSEGQQRSLCDPIVGNVRALHKQLLENRGRGPDLDLTSQEGAEIWRMLGSMELLPVAVKIELGNMIIALVSKKRMFPVYDALIWTFGRLGARCLLYGPLNAIVPSSTAVQWIQKRMRVDKNRQPIRPIDHFALMELARKRDDRYLDIPENVRDEVARFLEQENVSENLLRLVLENSIADEKARDLIFGESFPLGLKIAENMGSES